ncbi:MAG: TOBE domain-containing protein, partial [Burkholderiales bacterium]
GTNWISGNVTRQSYLGQYRDYLVTLASGATARTITPVDVNIEKGQTVWLHLPPKHCRALAH